MEGPFTICVDGPSPSPGPQGACKLWSLHFGDWGVPCMVPSYCKGRSASRAPPPSSVDTLTRLGKLRVLKTDYGQDSGGNSFPIPFPRSSPKPTLMPGLSVPILHPLTRPALWNPKSSPMQNLYLSLSLSPHFPGQVHRHHPSHPDRYFRVFSEARTGRTSSIETQTVTTVALRVGWSVWRLLHPSRKRGAWKQAVPMNIT